DGPGRVELLQLGLFGVRSPGNVVSFRAALGVPVRRDPLRLSGHSAGLRLWVRTGLRLRPTGRRQLRLRRDGPLLHRAVDLRRVDPPPLVREDGRSWRTRRGESSPGFSRLKPRTARRLILRYNGATGPLSGAPRTPGSRTVPDGLRTPS